MVGSDRRCRLEGLEELGSAWSYYLGLVDGTKRLRSTVREGRQVQEHGDEGNEPCVNLGHMLRGSSALTAPPGAPRCSSKRDVAKRIASGT